MWSLDDLSRGNIVEYGIAYLMSFLQSPFSYFFKSCNEWLINACRVIPVNVESNGRKKLPLKALIKGQFFN